MSMDISANFKIAAGVVGQAAVDNLNKGVDKLNTGVSSLPGIARTAGLAMAGLGAGLSISVLKDKFDGVVESILKVKEASEVTGSSIDKIGAIVQASKITGDDFGQIEAGITKMNKALAGSDDEAKGGLWCVAMMNGTRARLALARVRSARSHASWVPSTSPS